MDEETLVNSSPPLGSGVSSTAYRDVGDGTIVVTNENVDVKAVVCGTIKPKKVGTNSFILL